MKKIFKFFSILTIFTIDRRKKPEVRIKEFKSLVLRVQSRETDDSEQLTIQQYNDSTVYQLTI